MVAPAVASSKRGGAVVVRAMADDSRPTILVAEPLGEAGGWLRRVRIPQPWTPIEFKYSRRYINQHPVCIDGPRS